MLLKINVLLFLIPLFGVGVLYRSIAVNIKVWLGIHRHTSLVVTAGEPLLLSDGGAFGINWGMEAILIAAGLYLLVVLVLFAIGLVRDFIRKHPVHRAVRISGITMDPTVESLVRKMGIKRKVSVCLCPEENQIAAIGIFRPIIFFKAPVKEKEREYLISHELYHIKRYDVLWVEIAGIARCIHFWNPFVHFLYWELREMMEQSCDENVVSELSVEARGMYAAMLVRNSLASTVNVSGAVFYGGSRDKKAMEERVKNIMEKNTGKKWSRRAASLLLVLTLWVTSLTALAYDDVNWWEGSMSKTVDGTLHQARMNYAYVMLQEDAASLELELSSIPILYEREYVDGEGNVYPFMEGAQPKAPICIFHSYQAVRIVEHYLADEGDCEVYYYNADRCEKCGKTKNKTFLSSAHYAVCPHSAP